MADVRGKFRVTAITQNVWNKDARDITLSAQYSNSLEDNSYAASTPSAQITMSVNNPDAIEKLPLGKYFYVDFTAIDEPAAQ